MVAQTLTLPLPVLRRNAAKATEFARLQDLNTAKKGSLTLWRSRRGIWYALLSVSMEVPATKQPHGWVGVDRGQRHLAVVSTPEGMTRFHTYPVVRQVRRHYAGKRCGYRGHADHNASRNLGHWVGASCPLVLQKGMSVMGVSVPGGAVDGSPQARYATAPARGTGQERESHAL
jgi:transposase